MGGEQSKTSGLEGFQIASVVPQSPAHEGGLIPYFDFVVGTDGVQLDRENSGDFRDYIKKHKDRPTQLKVYNSKTKVVRDVVITPTDTWGGAGLLGCSINWEAVDQAQEYIWHITDVRPNTPASLAGIQAGRDYLIGMQTASEEGPLYITMFSDKTDFHARLSFINAVREDAARRGGRFSQVLLLLYDHVDNAIRELMVDLGQSLSLGCDVANGYLHAVPSVQGDTRLPIVRQFYIDSNEQTAKVEDQARISEPPSPQVWANPALQGVPVMAAGAAVPQQQIVVPKPAANVASVAAAPAHAHPVPLQPQRDATNTTPQYPGGQEVPQPAWMSALNSTTS